MFKSVMVVNVVAEGEPVIIDVDSVVVSRVEDSEAKVIIEIHMKILIQSLNLEVIHQQYLVFDRIQIYCLCCSVT